MTDKELIKQEIEYRLSSGRYSINSKQALLDIIVFIDSLPEEPASEDLEDEIERFLDEDENIPSYSKTARHFAEWQKQVMKDALQTEYEKGRFDMREEMMKNTVDATVKYQIGSQIIPQRDRYYQVLSERVHIDDVNLGDKVKIIIVKED